MCFLINPLTAKDILKTFSRRETLYIYFENQQIHLFNKHGKFISLHTNLTFDIKEDEVCYTVAIVPDYVHNLFNHLDAYVNLNPDSLFVVNFKVYQPFRTIDGAYKLPSKPNETNIGTFQIPTKVIPPLKFFKIREKAMNKNNEKQREREKCKGFTTYPTYLLYTYITNSTNLLSALIEDYKEQKEDGETLIKILCSNLTSEFKILVQEYCFSLARINFYSDIFDKAIDQIDYKDLADKLFKDIKQ